MNTVIKCLSKCNYVHNQLQTKNFNYLYTNDYALLTFLQENKSVADVFLCTIFFKLALPLLVLVFTRQITAPERSPIATHLHCMGKLLIYQYQQRHWYSVNGRQKSNSQSNALPIDLTGRRHFCPFKLPYLDTVLLSNVPGTFVENTSEFL